MYLFISKIATYFLYFLHRKEPGAFPESSFNNLALVSESFNKGLIFRAC